MSEPLERIAEALERLMLNDNERLEMHRTSHEIQMEGWRRAQESAERWEAERAIRDELRDVEQVPDPGEEIAANLNRFLKKQLGDTDV
jgi:hypothetical protein